MEHWKITEKYLFLSVQKFYVITKFTFGIIKPKGDIRKCSGIMINTAGTKNMKEEMKMDNFIEDNYTIFGQ